MFWKIWIKSWLFQQRFYDSRFQRSWNNTNRETAIYDVENDRQEDNKTIQNNMCGNWILEEVGFDLTMIYSSKGVLLLLGQTEKALTSESGGLHTACYATIRQCVSYSGYFVLQIVRQRTRSSAVIHT